ncbi:SEC-C domain-containing protein [Streptomyces sp. MUM 203J]|uniref:SEC-C domain-containing protein n=1 Tax=Streptomyces sp. MUM 203J TaxID=2791990 RepID=UPI001F0342E3|nr:SEC-C domain-containing protein [Streptomyces sp. MUM 203J]MCH0540455.1 SEC-C domain-containing protein [Streptomyces sp. MUM 203J]
MRLDTPADHTNEAERLLRTAEQYPEDREPLFLRAAAHLELAGDRARATTLYDTLLSVPPAPENPALIRALKAANLWEYGHEAEAKAIIEGLRVLAPTDAAAWEIIAETLEAHDELADSEAAFTTAAEALAPHPLSDDEVSYPTQSLLTGRHRVRRMLALPHDDWDMLADRLHRGDVPLDDLHDPKRTWALGSSDPAELQEEITRLRSELGTYRTALSRPFPVAVLHWPEAELTELVASYPELEREYPTYQAHLTDLEASLRELAAAGTPNLGIVRGTVPSYEAFAASESTPPANPALLPQYATTLAARGHATPWPPARTSPCWCGSGAAYGECHGEART